MGKNWDNYNNIIDKKKDKGGDDISLLSIIVSSKS